MNDFWLLFGFYLLLYEFPVEKIGGKIKTILKKKKKKFFVLVLDEWTISASYYAKYFVIYALLSRIGIKCEIHDCTVALFSYLFGSDILPQLMQDLKQAKDRVDVQYYNAEVKIDSSATIVKTKEFVIKIEEIIDGLNPQKIADI